MSAPGTHWKIKEEPKTPAPCFKCATEPRLDGHVVCSGCHREESCPKCFPALAFSVPAHLTRSASTVEAESGWGT